MTDIAPVVPASKVWGIPRTWALAAVALAAALAFPLAYGSNAYILNIATMVLIYAVTGSSWNLLGGYAGQPSFGHAAFSASAPTPLRYSSRRAASGPFLAS